MEGVGWAGVAAVALSRGVCGAAAAAVLLLLLLFQLVVVVGLL